MNLFLHFWEHSIENNNDYFSLFTIDLRFPGHSHLFSIWTVMKYENGRTIYNPIKLILNSHL